MLKRLNTTDIDDIYAIERCSHAAPWTERKLRQTLASNTACYGLMAADNTLLGYVMLRLVLDEAEIYNLCIAKTHQGNGLGKKLLLGLASLLKSQQIRSLFLEVRASNCRAFRLYSAVGFTVDHVRVNYYSNLDKTKEDALLMSLTLD